MANLYFGANVGNEILYNNQAYVLKETTTALGNQVTTPYNESYMYNIARRTFSLDNDNNSNSYQYPIGAEAASYIYGYKNQGIEYDNPLFPQENFISPSGIFYKPKKLLLRYSNYYSASAPANYQCRYEAIEAEINEWIAPKDGILRAGGGIFSEKTNNIDPGGIPTIGFDRNGNLSTISDTPKIISYNNESDNISIEQYIWINDMPITIPYEKAFYNNQEYLNKNFYKYSCVFHVNKGDRVSFRPTYVKLILFSVPSEIDCTVSPYNGIIYYFNGIFYPYEP